MKQLNSEHYQYIDDALRQEDIHDSWRLGTGTFSSGLFILLAIIITAVQIFNSYLFFMEGLWIGFPVIIHLVLAAIPAFIGIVQMQLGRDARYFYLLASTCLFAGVFGALGSLLCVLLNTVFNQTSQRFEDWFESIFPHDDVSLAEELFDEIETGADENPIEYSVMAFDEIMRLGSESQKRRALSKMTVSFDPKFSAAFKAALKDSNNNIRVQAASAVARIENEFNKKLLRIEEAQSLDPHNPRINYVLARFYDDYSFTGILDRDRERQNREAAAQHYQQYLEHDPNNAGVWLAVGRLFYRNNQLENAIEWFEQGMQRGHNIHNIHTILPWYLECLYALERYDVIRSVAKQYAQQITHDDSIPAHIKSAALLWIPESSILTQQVA